MVIAQKMTEFFDDELLQEFTQGFYGYGNCNGDCWFVGMEEGGGNSFQDIANRSSAWSQRGKRELEDVAEYHAAIGVTCFFDDPPKLTEQIDSDCVGHRGIQSDKIASWRLSTAIVWEK